MRVDGTGINDIFKPNTKTEIKGQDTGRADTAAKAGAVSYGEKSHGVKATTVEKAFFSWESELERLGQAAAEIDVEAIHQQMAILSNTLSESDLKHLGEEGFSLNDTQVETIVTVVDKIKMELAKGGMDISIFGDDLSLEKLQAIAPNAGQAYQMAADLRQCSQEEAAYLVANEQEPTIENLYRAQHSGSVFPAREQAPIPEDEGFQKQIAAVIARAGLPVNETTMGYGAMLLQKGAPLTPENVSYMQKLMDQQLPPDEEELRMAVSEAVTEQKRPAEAYLVAGYSAKDRAFAASQVMNEATEQEVAQLEQQGEPVTIARLEQLSRQREDSSTEQQNTGKQESQRPAREGTSGQDAGTISARRRLEEIRLVMTVEANYRLLRRGISIETMELSQLVEELKGLEQEYCRELFGQQGIEATEENTALFIETAQKTKELMQMPAYLLGRFLSDPATILDMHQAGRSQQAELTGSQAPYEPSTGTRAPYEPLARAQASYETSMTAPRADLGDSIQKAFRNVDDILQDLNLDTSDSNRRAVRILAYNQMELTTQNIRQVKALDEKMQQVFQNLKPRVVMEMIREGVNPLRTDIDTLNAKAGEIREQLDPGGEESYSRYLWQLEQRGQVTEQERESYIGIYRLLRQIEKTDGAVIGAVANQGSELTLGNLLHAVRSRRSRGMDVRVDETTGAAEEIKPDETAIDRQIEAAYQTDCAKDALHSLSAQSAETLVENDSWQEMTPEQLLEALLSSAASQEAEENQPWLEEYRQQLQQFAQNQDTEAAVLRLLESYQLPVDTYHIQAVSRMISQRNATFRQLFGRERQERTPDLKAVQQELLERFSEAIKTPEEMAKAQQELAETAEHVMDTMLEEEELTSVDVRQLKIMRTEISISTRMSREETYAIPVLIGDEMTNVQLKIVRGREKRGMVDILLSHQRLGKLEAHIQVTENRTEGFLVSDRQETLDQLREQQETLQEQLKFSEEWQVRLDYHCQNTEMGAAGFGGGQGQEEAGPDYEVQTSRLYGAAKSFMDALMRL